jgi:hypothetical protein
MPTPAEHAQTVESLNSPHTEAPVDASNEVSGQSHASNPTQGEGSGQGEESVEVDTTVGIVHRKMSNTDPVSSHKMMTTLPTKMTCLRKPPISPVGHMY